MNKNDFKSTYFECACTSTEHTFCVKGFPEDKEFYLCMQLPKQRFFTRLAAGIKYIFGYQSKYGHWDECLLDEERFCDLFNSMVGFAHKAGIKNKSAKKIKTALDDISKGNKNDMVTLGLHSESKRDILAKNKK